jgi:elongation factor G
MGEVHLDVMISRLQKQFGADVIVEKPRVPYRETIRASSKGEGKHKRQTGGRGQYGHALIEISPLEMNGEETFRFENHIFGGAIPGKYIPPIEKGIKETMSKGILAGCQILWVKINLYDGSFHDVDSSDIAFQLAGSFAFKHAFEEAKPVLVEPILVAEITVPEEYMGDVIGDLNSRRGRILGIEPLGKTQLVKASVPQAEMDKYATTLRSITKGRGVNQMKFSHYEEVPQLLAEKIIEALKEKAEKEKH